MIIDVLFNAKRSTIRIDHIYNVFEEQIHCCNTSSLIADIDNHLNPGDINID